MNRIEEILQRYGVLLLDGGLATELERRGCDLGDPLWSARVLLESPELIKQVHADYFAAGADCTISATYQATFEGFARRGLDAGRAAELMRLAVRLAIEARDEFWESSGDRNGRPRPLVAASIGSYGAFRADGSEYTGDYGLMERDLMEFHRPRLAVLAATEADVLACETIPCLLEAVALARLLDEFPGKPAWISFSARDGGHNGQGEPIGACAERLSEFAGIAAIGINCTAPHHVPDLVSALRAATDLPVVAYPNSGETYLPAQIGWTGDGERAAFGNGARSWYENGARLIGGCCRTGPDDIRALATWARHQLRTPSVPAQEAG